jgi:16S rRNA (guanine527-N7)-methyltransferase
MDHALTETLRIAQRLGFFGAAPIEEAIEHARGYLPAVGPLPAGGRLADLGSGGGLPGLVLATAYPDVEVVLIDRRQKRTDFLERAIRRLDITNTSVWCRDVAAVAREVESGQTAPFDVVTARGFGPPTATLTLATRLLVASPGGQIVISEPPAGDRWDPALLTRLGLVGERVGTVRRFGRVPGSPG